MKGISTTRRTTDRVACLRRAGVDFIARYYSATTLQPEKRLTLSEAQAISSAGMTIITVYEDGPTNVSYFSSSRGHRDGVNAYHAASQMLQPGGSAIYFAVDYDATPSEIAQPISDYFRAVRQGFIDAAQGTTPIYSIGVYGSGACCEWIKAQLQLATYAWLAESTGWHGSHGYSDWNIKQSIAARDLCGFAAGVGGSYEDNDGQNGIGDFKVATPSAVVDAVAAAMAEARRKAPARTRGRAAASRAPALAAGPNGWKALFSMHLEASTELLAGRLSLTNGAGAEMLNMHATSGTRGHQAKGDIWKKQRGPIPPSPNTSVGNCIETTERSTPIISREFRIRPEEVVQPDPPHTKRSAFRVHRDGGAPGSAGCIAISDGRDFERFAGMMHDLRNQGVETVSLTINYK